MKKLIILIILFSTSFAFNLTFMKIFNDFSEGENLLKTNPSLANEKFQEAYKLIQKLKIKNYSSQINYMLGQMYFHGWGVTQNYNLAKKYLLKAIKLGNKRANCSLAKLYLKLNKIDLAQKYLKIALSNKTIVNDCKNLIIQLKNIKEQQ